jgi:hypothetical protein
LDNVRALVKRIPNSGGARVIIDIFAPLFKLLSRLAAIFITMQVNLNPRPLQGYKLIININDTPVIGWIWDVERDNVQMHVRHIFQKFSSTPFVHFAK